MTIIDNESDRMGYCWALICGALIAPSLGNSSSRCRRKHIGITVRNRKVSGPTAREYRRAHVPTPSCRLVTSRAILRTSTTRDKSGRDDIGGERIEIQILSWRYCRGCFDSIASSAYRTSHFLSRSVSLPGNIYVYVSQLISRVVQTRFAYSAVTKTRHRNSPSIDVFDVSFRTSLPAIQADPNLTRITDNVSSAGKLSIAYNSVLSGNIENDGRKTTTSVESTGPPAKVGSANRLPVLRSVIICRSDIELAEEIPRDGR